MSDFYKMCYILFCRSIYYYNYYTCTLLPLFANGDWFLFLENKMTGMRRDRTTSIIIFHLAFFYKLNIASSIYIIYK